VEAGFPDQDRDSMFELVACRGNIDVLRARLLEECRRLLDVFLEASPP